MMPLDDQPSTGLMAAVHTVVNAAFRRIESMFPGYFSETKHNYYGDYGWPTVLTDIMLYQMYSRNGLAGAAVEKTILKSWQTSPQILESETPTEGEFEKTMRQWFDDLRFWQRVAEADRRSLVTRYSAIILRIADGKTFDQPVVMVGGGLTKLVELIPAWSLQLKPSQWDNDRSSTNYGNPTMYQFSESALGATSDQSMMPNGQGRQFNIHPDRIIIWSKDGTLFSKSLLEQGYNDLMTMEKISGAGGEGFWKNAKSAPYLEMDKEANINDMARAMGVTVDKVADAMNAQVSDWQRGFDQVLMLQGMKAQTLGVTLPSPEHFFAIALQSFAASIPIPLKILIGMQTGERSSTEDSKEWNQTNHARRINVIKPLLRTIIQRMEKFGIIPQRDWFIKWEDLTGATISEKLDQASKMAEINAKAAAQRELVFLPEEIRAAIDMGPLTVAQRTLPDPGGADAGLPAKPGAPAPVQPPKPGVK